MSNTTFPKIPAFFVSVHSLAKKVPMSEAMMRELAGVVGQSVELTSLVESLKEAVVNLQAQNKNHSAGRVNTTIEALQQLIINTLEERPFQAKDRVRVIERKGRNVYKGAYVGEEFIVMEDEAVANGGIVSIRGVNWSTSRDNILVCSVFLELLEAADGPNWGLQSEYDCVKVMNCTTNTIDSAYYFNPDKVADRDSAFQRANRRLMELNMQH